MRRRSGCLCLTMIFFVTLYASVTVLLNAFRVNSSTSMENLSKSDSVVRRNQIFPQSGGLETFNQPWNVPYRYALSSMSQLHKLNRNLIFSNFTYSKGLGNLMFQLASLYGTAVESGAQLVIPRSNLLTRSFVLSDDIVVVEDSLMNEILENHLNYKEINLSDSFKYVNLTEEAMKGNTILLGYFQNYRYFHPSHKNEIRELFTFLPEVQQQASEFLKNTMLEYAVDTGIEVDGNPDDQNILVEDNPLSSETSIIGVHVRHGIDIRMNSRNTAHGHVSAPVSYYRKAMKAARQEVGKAFFVICSDDITWAKRMFTKKEFGPIYFCPNNWREVDMAILTMSDVLILSTGTFSWWSGYLNDNVDDIYYYSEWPRVGSDMHRMFNKSEYFLDSWTAMDDDTDSGDELDQNRKTKN